MRQIVGSRIFRLASRYTLGLWIAGFAILELMMAALGRQESWTMPLFSLPYELSAILLAFVLQYLVVASGDWPVRWRAAAIGLAIPLFALAQGCVDMVVNYYTGVYVFASMRGWAELTAGDALRAAFLYGWVYSLNAALVMLVLAGSHSRGQADEIARERMNAQAAQAAMLRYQLNPHFLFNALNAISSLVVTKDNDRAEEMIGKLSSFLRASIGTDPNTLIPLRDELGIVEEYLEVEAVRFGARLGTVYQCDAATGGVLVPSFLLQPIVENAVKYAVAPSRDAVTIRIEACEEGGELALTIADDGTATGGAETGGTGIGLANVRSRLAAVYGRAASVEAGPVAGGFRVALRMPAWRSAPG